MIGMGGFGYISCDLSHRVLASYNLRFCFWDAQDLALGAGVRVAASPCVVACISASFFVMLCI